eukprot:6911711-Heterocapsa_arctica.AAC.1
MHLSPFWVNIEKHRVSLKFSRHGCAFRHGAVCGGAACDGHAERRTGLGALHGSIASGLPCRARGYGSLAA